MVARQDPCSTLSTCWFLKNRCNMFKPLSLIKQLVLPTGRRPSTVLSGAFAGLRMHLDYSYETQYYLGLAEREVFGSLKDMSTGIRSAIDIGAASGEYTLYFMKRTSAERIVSFEPRAEARIMIGKNIRLNGLGSDSR